ncbi:TIGR03085 family metal-binding protein [Actinokineospora sp. NBRC 105648]|uniref:TIGR03085 family metal-binding protein n=1 Tax=Actinokineospora sp. NBRC 105648 TaxID=3032206 RepID=UPI0024A4232B|nr:TIGR03085 family metal-binding protein [Actinokineospora sp. NBRC 105648]GLZ40144.1 TIGR03085 family protein [Actinokineospora sp. NBRC 105648]
MGVAKDERAQLSNLFTEVGPDAPTLCEGWATRDLAAHLVVRERRLDAAPGILVKALAGYAERVRAGYAAKPWAELVELVRTGPSGLSPFRIGVVDELVNTTEFFIHHEDVRRAEPGWEPRPADAERDSALWTGLTRTAKLHFRKSPVGVVLRTPDGRSVTARPGTTPVTIVGEPGELLLDAFGRSQARVEFEGSADAVAAVRALSRGL